MKKLFCTLLMLALMLLCGGALAEGVLVSTPMETGVPQITADSPLVQDMYSYMDNRMSFDQLETNKSNQSYRGFSGGEDTYELIEDYVNTLCSGAYNFELVDSHYEDYGSAVFFSYALRYTGNARVDSEKSEMNFVDGVYGDMTIWVQMERGRTKRAQIHLVSGLEFADLGLRVEGGQADTSLPGESLGAELYRMPDGSYKTGDGRFHVRPGEAQIYRDGETYTTEATLTRNQAKNREELRIFNFYRNESIILTVPYNSVLTGDVLDKSQIGLNDDGGFDKYMGNMEDFLGWAFSNKILGVCHDGEYFLCYTDDHNDFDDAVVRVMYWDPAQDAAVFYICATFDTAPYEYEVMAAVGMGGTPQSTGADAVLDMVAGETLEINFGGTEFGASYELFTWEILEGSNLIELTGTRSQTCKVKAYDPGTVRLRVRYEYGVEGKNVLTGNPQPEQKSKTREIVINIAP